MATKKQKEHAWNNAKKIRGKNPNLYRRDSEGNEICKWAYGKKGPKSWEIHHKHPLSRGGTNSPRNLEAMQTRANRRKGNKYP